MYVVWLLPLGGALAFNEFDESATRETQPAKTQLRQCPSRHAMTQRLRWRTDRCATVPSQCPPPPRYPSTCCLPHLSSALWFSQIRGAFAGLSSCSEVSSRVAGQRLVSETRPFTSEAFVIVCWRKSQSEQTHFAGQEEISHPYDRALAFGNKPPDSLILPLNADAILSVLMIENVIHLRQVHPFDGWVVYSKN